MTFFVVWKASYSKEDIKTTLCKQFLFRPIGTSCWVGPNSALV